MSDKLIKQHNAITTAQYEMTALEKNIFYMLLVQLDDREPSKGRYFISVKDLELKTEKNIDHIQFRYAVERLVNRVLFTKQETGHIKVNLLSSGEYRGGKAEVEISKEIRALLFAVKRNFTIFRLEMALNLPSKYAKRMYEMVSQFKDTGMMQITVEELKKRLGLIDLETGKERYKEFAWFKRYVLDIAQKELAENTDISFTYTAKKTGKKYTHLEFQIKYTARAQEATQLNAAAQLPPQKTDVRKGAQKQYPHPDLEGETLNQYLILTEEFCWLDKKLAYKVVKSIPTKTLWQRIGQLSTELQAGRPIKPAVYFEEVLNQSRKLNAAAQLPLKKTDARKGTQKQYPYPALEGETLKLYLKLTKE